MTLSKSTHSGREVSRLLGRFFRKEQKRLRKLAAKDAAQFQQAL
jgi:hypothetical protein